MIPIGLICEGPTDRAVLERLFAGLSGDTARINPIQPPSPMGPTDFGGWQQVFSSIERKDISGALAFNDRIVVQIDSDVCEEVGFDVSRRVEGRERTDEELVLAIEERLVTHIRTHDPDADLGRVAFAICVNELECWLLLHLSPKADETHGCLKRANAILKRQDRPLLASKDVRAYQDAAKDLRKPKAVATMAGRSPSFDRFVTSVSAWWVPAP